MPTAPKYHRHYPRQRDERQPDPYYLTAAWKRLRRMQLIRFPWCERCKDAATDVDHVVERSAGGPDSLDNLQSLCKRCHSRKTFHGV